MILLEPAYKIFVVKIKLRIIPVPRISGVTTCFSEDPNDDLSSQNCGPQCALTTGLAVIPTRVVYLDISNILDEPCNG
jgi:hypothetical protein